MFDEQYEDDMTNTYVADIIELTTFTQRFCYHNYEATLQVHEGEDEDDFCDRKEEIIDQLMENEKNKPSPEELESALPFSMVYDAVEKVIEHDEETNDMFFNNERFNEEVIIPLTMHIYTETLMLLEKQGIVDYQYNPEKDDFEFFLVDKPNK